jgi:hypothetical protein
MFRDWGMRRFAALGLALMLAAFAPPDRAPVPEPSQQAPIPKSWMPGTTSVYSHGADLICKSSGGPQAASKPFVQSFQAASAAFKSGHFEEAIRLAEIAAAYPRSGRQWMGIEDIRIHSFFKLGNDGELIASLEAALSAKGCLSEEKTVEYRRMLEAARARLPR